MAVFQNSLPALKIYNFTLSLRQIMCDSWFVTVQNSQFSIHIRFVNNANGHIRRIALVV